MSRQRVDLSFPHRHTITACTDRVRLVKSTRNRCAVQSSAAERADDLYFVIRVQRLSQIGHLLPISLWPEHAHPAIRL
jgi:hypothetical protein